MLCPFCSNEDTKVLESRVTDGAMRRRRECFKCSNRFTTYERASFNLTVLKKNAEIQPFDIQKIHKSIQKACHKEDPQVVSQLTRRVEQKVLRRKTNQIKTTVIGRLVLQELKKHNKIAYLRYTTIHKDIDDPKLLEKEINLIA